MCTQVLEGHRSQDSTHAHFFPQRTEVPTLSPHFFRYLHVVHISFREANPQPHTVCVPLDDRTSLVKTQY